MHEASERAGKGEEEDQEENQKEDNIDMEDQFVDIGLDLPRRGRASAHGCRVSRGSGVRCSTSSGRGKHICSDVQIRHICYGLQSQRKDSEEGWKKRVEWVARFVHTACSVALENGDVGNEWSEEGGERKRNTSCCEHGLARVVM